MIRPLRRLRRWFALDPIRSSWLAILLGSLLIVSGQLSLASDFSPTPMMLRLRVAHVLFAMVVAVGAILLRRRWNRTLGGWSLLLLTLPLYPLSWLFHVEAAQAGETWLPLAGFKLYFLALSVLIAGPYWLNALLIAGFAVETMLIWRLLDLRNLPSAVTVGEPVTTTLYAAVSVAMLAFRVYHDSVARALARTQAKAETLEQMARIFLTLRDRANTPIQTLEGAAELLRVKHPEAERLSAVIKRASDRLAHTANLLARLESQIAWTGDELMTDEEILRWLDRLERSARTTSADR